MERAFKLLDIGVVTMVRALAAINNHTIDAQMPNGDSVNSVHFLHIKVAYIVR